MMTIRRAVPGDLRTILTILHSVSRWLHERGYEQWPDGSPSLGPAKIGAQISRGEFWIAGDGRDPVAVIAISGAGDRDFWSPAELAEPAVYISKAAVVRRLAGRGTGALLLRWARDHAAADGARWVRLDAWKTNADLQAYYRRQGWDYVRTTEAEGRNSGALFQLPAEADPEARAAFAYREPPAPGPGRIEQGMRVIVADSGVPVSAIVTRVTVDAGHGITEAGWEHGDGPMPAVYIVRRDGEEWVARQAWPDPASVT